MKTKLWIAVIAAVLALCAVLSVFLLQPGEGGTAARVLSDGALVRTIDLTVDQTFTVERGGGVNVITVRDGKVAVTEADCPDHTCMAMGFRNGGTPIVCLPNALVIEFPPGEAADGAVG